MTSPAKQKQQTTNWKDCNTAMKARGSLLIFTDSESKLAVNMLTVQLAHELRGAAIVVHSVSQGMSSPISPGPLIK